MIRVADYLLGDLFLAVFCLMSRWERRGTWKVRLRAATSAQSSMRH